MQIWKIKNKKHVSPFNGTGRLVTSLLETRLRTWKEINAFISESQSGFLCFIHSTTGKYVHSTVTVLKIHMQLKGTFLLRYR